MLAEVANIERLQQALSELDRVGFYQDFAAQSIVYGPAFQGVVRIWSGEGESLAEVALPEELPTLTDSLHPALLMPVFRRWPVPCLKKINRAASTYLPFGWERLLIRDACPSACGTRLRLTSADSTETGGCRKR